MIESLLIKSGYKNIRTFNEQNRTVNTKSVEKREKVAKERSVIQYNKRHRTRKLSDLHEGDSVWVTDLRSYGKIVSILNEPNSFLVETNFGVYRRNRWHIIPTPYFVHPKFTPTLSANQNNESIIVTESDTQNDTTVEIRESDTSGSDRQLSDFPSSSVRESPCKRPIRDIRKPHYLKDYVLSFALVLSNIS